MADFTVPFCARAEIGLNVRIAEFQKTYKTGNSDWEDILHSKVSQSGRKTEEDAGGRAWARPITGHRQPQSCDCYIVTPARSEAVDVRTRKTIDK